MAGDIKLREALLITDDSNTKAATSLKSMEMGRPVHIYGERVKIIDQGLTEGLEAAVPETSRSAMPKGLSDIEALGAAAFHLRQSAAFLQTKANRPRQGQQWNLPNGGCTGAPKPEGAAAPRAAAAPPTSAFLEGPVAVGVVIVSGPATANLQFSDAERTKVVAEVQNGLSFYASTNPAAGLSFTYDIQHVQLTVQSNPNASDLEALWRDPAMVALGFPGTWAGVQQYIESLRTRFKTRWTYCVFFTKYPVSWFAYATLGGPRIVMQYDNDGWGPDNIDRVFAHETGHIFNAPDEYANSNCDCGGRWGRWGKPNSNCQNCAPGGGISCIMKGNDWTMCPVTPAHIGWTPLRVFSKSSHKSLDISGASTGNGAALIQYDYHGGGNQLFHADPLGDGCYRLVCMHSGKVLDVSGWSTANGAQIIQYDWHGGDNQRFRIEPLGDGHVRITAKHSGKVLDVSGGSAASGAKIIQYDWHGGDNQRWLLTVPAASKNSGKVLDVSGGSTANGAQVIQYDYHGGGNQIFRPEPLGDGCYRLVAQHSGKVLDVSGASTANGAQIIQYDWHGGNNQRFRIEPLGDGHVRIIAKHSGKVLDVSGASTANGAQIIQYDWHGGNNQRWLLPLW